MTPLVQGQPGLVFPNGPIPGFLTEEFPQRSEHSATLLGLSLSDLRYYELCACATISTEMIDGVRSSCEMVRTPKRFECRHNGEVIYYIPLAAADFWSLPFRKWAGLEERSNGKLEEGKFGYRHKGSEFEVLVRSSPGENGETHSLQVSPIKPS